MILAEKLRNAAGGGGGLYDFTSFTFTAPAAYADKYYAPSMSLYLASYDTVTNAWLLDTAFYNIVDAGIQEWTVPVTGTYNINAKGAKGADNSSYNNVGGEGADLSVDVQLEKGTVLKIVTGQRGSWTTSTEGGGGGGGSFVWTGDIGGNGLIIAAGGGGGADDGGGGGYSARSDLNPTYEATVTTNNGEDGATNGGSNAYGPGGGWLNDYYSKSLGGVNYNTYNTPGYTVTKGYRAGQYFEGGSWYSSDYANGSYGGFGGGGANYDDGGAGGGFTGGSTSSGPGGGAGGSYYAGLTVSGGYTSIHAANTSNFVWNGTHNTVGRVTITLI